MGLSASQARLISLEARMSDVEYEGQQINQQRLVLSNKMNEIQERVYNMDVPTPPSKQDFMYDVYTGKTKNGKKVEVKLNGDGSLNITQTKNGTIVEKGDTLKVTTGAVDNSAITTNSDGSVTPKGMELMTKDVTLTMFDTPGDIGRDFWVTVPSLKPETETCQDQDVLRALAKGEMYTKNGNTYRASQNSTFTPTGYFFGTPSNPKNSKEVDGDIVQASANNCDFMTYAPTEVETGKMIENPNGTESVHITADGKFEPSTYTIPSTYALKDGVKNIVDQTCKTEGGKSYSIKEMCNMAPKALTDQGLKGLNWWYKDPGCTQSFTYADVCKDEDTYQIKDGIKRYHFKAKEQTDAEKAMDVADGELTIAGNKTMTIADAETLWGADPDSTWSRCYSGLKHSQGNYNSETGDRKINEDEWRVIVSGTGDNATFSFFRVEDLAKGQVQEYKPAQGEFDDDPETIEPNDPRIKYDEDTGHLSEIKLKDGTTVVLMYGQECDEPAYEKAHNKYLYMKSLYDQEQNDLNKQTSIYQRQDKQLELKLTRLDTERNSLNTEIEAVKKVIQDAAEDFKTFSG